jgi:predicted Fe-S protein YdhL (DUF1289 family)
MKFNPCQGGNNCTQDGTHCQGCGRSHEEIAATGQLVDTLLEFANKMEYENVDEFLMAVAQKAAGKHRMMQMNASSIGGISISP